MEMRWKEAREKNTVRSFCLPCTAARYWCTQARHTLGQKDLFFYSQYHLWEQQDWHLHLECLASRSPWEVVHCSVLAGPGFGC